MSPDPPCMKPHLAVGVHEVLLRWAGGLLKYVTVADESPDGEAHKRSTPQSMHARRTAPEPLEARGISSKI